MQPHQSLEIRLRLEPARERSLWPVPGHAAHAMLETGSDLEDQRVAGSRIGLLVKDLTGCAIADLKQAPIERLATQVDAQRDQAIVSEVIVPFVVVTGRIGKPVDTAQERADRRTSGQSFDKAEQPIIIGQKPQEGNTGESYLREASEPKPCCERS